MDIKKSSLVELFRTLLGLAFIISGLAKAFDTNHFGQILSSYGIEQLYFISPVIIFMEILLGLTLIFGIYTRISAMVSIVMVFLFTIIYTYGYVVLNVKDCGCYGNIAVFKSAPLMVYVRNILLMTGAYYVYIKSSETVSILPASVLYASLIFTFGCAFICGYTIKHHMDFNESESHNTFVPVSLSNHVLQHYIETNKDSTYLVTVFSYSCPHCINSIANIEQYQRFNLVDKVIGIGVKNAVEETEIFSVFEPSFSVTDYSFDEIKDLSEDFPTSYFIRNDSIVQIIKGEMPSAYFYIQ